MASITQTIDNYVGGISQQPDEKKLPGQLVKAKNVLPDVVEGLKKRPGSNLIASLSDGSANSVTHGKWFHYYRDENEQYIGQISRSGTLKMWDCATGSEKTVTNNLTTTTAYCTYSRTSAGLVSVLWRPTGTDYAGALADHPFQVGDVIDADFITGGANDGTYEIVADNHGGDKKTFKFYDGGSSVISGAYNVQIKQNYLHNVSDADLQTLTLNDYTYITNRKKRTSMSDLESGDFNGDDNKNGSRQPEAFVELKKVSYASQYALNIYDDDSTDTLTTATRIKIEKTDTDETDTCPHVDTQIFNVNGFWTLDGTSYNSIEVSDDTSITINGDQLQYTLRKEKFVVDLAQKYNSDNWEIGAQGVIGGHDNDQEYFIQNTSGANWNWGSSGITDNAIIYNRYYKIRNTVTGEQLISAQCTGSSGNTGSTSAVITDVVNALKAGTAHSNLDTTTTGAGQSASNYPQANGTLLTTSKAYADMPFTLEADTSNSQIILTYKIVDQINHTTAGKWILSRCNSPTPTEIPTTGGNTFSLGQTTHGAGNNDNWNQAGRDRPNQYGDGAVDSASHSVATGQTATRDTSKGKDLYFRLTTTGQSVATGDSDDITYKCRYTTTYDLFHGGSGWTTGDTFNFAMKTGSSYKVTIEDISTSIVKANRGLIRPTPTSFDTKTVVTAESILGDLRAGIDADHNSNFNTATNGDTNAEITAAGGTYTSGVTQVGNGLHITRPSGTFNINTPSPELLNVFTNEIQDIADLPSQCVDGYTVKIRNSEATEDDYYVRFITDNGRKYGTGVWEECPKPGRKIKFDPDTMPVQLVRNADGTFTLDEIDWQICLVGNTTTVPEPSFIKTSDGLPKSNSNTYVGKINKMLFWRNRMVLLSDENVIMSQPGEFFNFWPKSSITYTATDAIDISVSSEFPAIIYDGVQTNSGLLLFSKNQQYLVTTDSDVLSPQTAKINTISTYNFNFNTNPISLGTTTAFLDNAGKFSRLWEMANVLREGEPVVVDQTKVVSKLFDKDLNLIANSRENSIIFFTKKDSSTIYGYKYFSSSEKRLQQSWFTWELAGTIQHIAVLDDALFVVLRNNSKDALQKIPIKIDDDTHTSVDDKGTTDTSDDVTYRIHLDNSKVVASSAASYSAGTDKTTFTLPDGFNNSSGQLVVYVVPSADDDTFSGMTAKATLNGSTVELAGNWKTYVDTDGNTQTPANNFVLGYNYDMEIQFPTIYYTQQTGDVIKVDTNGSLIIQRIKVNFGGKGLYETTIDRVGKTSYTETWEAPLADSYDANQVAIDDFITQTIPIYEKNKNLTIKLKSTHPAPATLYSMSWEGDFTNNFYQRV